MALKGKGGKALNCVPKAVGAFHLIRIAEHCQSQCSGVERGRRRGGGKIEFI